MCLMSHSPLQQPIFKRNIEIGRVVVNFNGDLVELMRETRYLDRMGFFIPEIALNVALQVRHRVSTCGSASRGASACGAVF